jgi:signal transduction histidine kinase
MESGRFELNTQVVFPAELIRSCVAELESQFSEKNQAVEQFISDPNVVFTADPKRLRQVMINLLSNASKYSPNDTGINIKCTVDADMVNFEVIDQGPGIAAEDVDRVFNLFDRGSNTMAQSQSGTGIGLYVARRIIESHGGSIAIRPLPDGGSVAKFSIPVVLP